MSLASLITENPDVVIAALSVVGGWLGVSKKKKDGLSKLKEQVLTRLRSELHELIDTHASPKAARVALGRAAHALLHELGIKRSVAVDAIVDAVIEQALKEYSERLGPVLMKSRLDELLAKLSQLPAAFEPRKTPISPTTQILGPDEKFTTFAEDEALARGEK